MEEGDGDDEWRRRSWLDATTKAMEEHDDEGHEEHDEDEEVVVRRVRIRR
ncbi:hypothetical protein YC2023_118849 [Brassica napus]